MTDEEIVLKNKDTKSNLKFNSIIIYVFAFKAYNFLCFFKKLKLLFKKERNEVLSKGRKKAGYSIIIV